MSDPTRSGGTLPLGWTRDGWVLVLSFFLGVGFMVGLILSNGPGTEEDLYGLALRTTARITLIAFLVAYLAMPLMRLSGAEWARGLVRNRRYWGVAAFVSHAFHLALIFAAVQKFYGGDWLAMADMPTLVFGGLGYVLFFAMALTSTNGWVQRLGPENWRRLHTFGMHYLWAIFTLTLLLGQLAEGPQAIQAFEVAALVIALGIRMVARRESE